MRGFIFGIFVALILVAAVWMFGWRDTSIAVVGAAAGALIGVAALASQMNPFGH